MFALKVDKLRMFMKHHELDAFIVPTSDNCKSEYIADFWKCREWLTGFTGSAGTAIVTQTHAGLWTDSRYFIQAKKELAKPFQLHKLKTREPEFINWLCSNLKKGNTVGLDPTIFSASEIERFIQILKPYHISVKTTEDPFLELWKNRPSLPIVPIYQHNESFCGNSRLEKIEIIRKHLNKNKIDVIIIAALDEIAWLLNLRSNEIKYNPVFSSYLALSLTKTYLFVDQLKLTDEISRILKDANISIKPFAEITDFVASFKPETIVETDAATMNFKLFNNIPNKVQVLKKASLIGKLKAIKSNTELAHYKNAQIRDGIAMCKFLKWIEDNIIESEITEITAAQKLEEFRKQGEHFVSISFTTISAYGANAAVPHYSPNTQKPVTLKPFGIYLVDSGAQYLDGTTDITRTISLGKPQQDEKSDFTLVLKGHINVATAVFPKGTKGLQIDTLARTAMWKYNKDFGHGTGHGIGYFLNVHEGPQGFSQGATGASQTILEKGMLTTNEPGMYIEGKYGIRTENVLACIRDSETEFGEFLKFKTTTYCPIDKNLIDRVLMNENEIEWLNNYHKKIYELLAPKIDKNLADWLRIKTSPII